MKILCPALAGELLEVAVLCPPPLTLRLLCRIEAEEAARPRAVVVGAGPAGAACAISLVNQGFTVDVLEVLLPRALRWMISQSM